MREAVIEKHLKDRARRAGGLCRKLRWIGRSGAPDRFLSLPAGHAKAGIWLAELKRPGKDAEEHQAREHERLREAGVRVVVLASLEAVDNFFDGPEGG